MNTKEFNVILNAVEKIDKILLQADADKEIVFEVLLLIKTQLDKIKEVL